MNSESFNQSATLSILKSAADFLMDPAHTKDISKNNTRNTLKPIVSKMMDDGLVDYGTWNSLDSYITNKNFATKARTAFEGKVQRTMQSVESILKGEVTTGAGLTAEEIFKMEKNDDSTGLTDAEFNVVKSWYQLMLLSDKMKSQVETVFLKQTDSCEKTVLDNYGKMFPEDFIASLKG